MRTILAAFLILAVATAVHAKSEIGESLEWLADTSPAIGIYTADAPAKREVMADYLQFDASLKLKETLKGGPPAELKSQSLYFIGKKDSPWRDVLAGDRFLVFFQPDVKAAKVALRVSYMISLSRPSAPVSCQALAYNAKFQVLTDEKAILSTVRERMAAHPGAEPLPRPGHWEECAVEVPRETSAHAALDRGSSVSMLLPTELAAPLLAGQDVRGIVYALGQYFYVLHIMPSGGSGKIEETLMNTSAKKGSSPFLPLSQESVAKFNKTGELLDPWGTPYRIDVSNPIFPWAYSFGPDKIDNGGAEGSDDVVSWRE